MRFWHGGTEYLASSGDMIVLNPGEVHDGRTDPAAGCRYHMLYVEQSAIEALFAADEPRLRCGLALKGPLLRDPALARLIARFAADPSADLEQQTMLARILLQLFARHGVPPKSTGVATILTGGAPSAPGTSTKPPAATAWGSSTTSCACCTGAHQTSSRSKISGASTARSSTAGGSTRARSRTETSCRSASTG